jgi:hypothetical protein
VFELCYVDHAECAGFVPHVVWLFLGRVPDLCELCRRSKRPSCGKIMRIFVLWRKGRRWPIVLRSLVRKSGEAIVAIRGFWVDKYDTQASPITSDHYFERGEPTR